MRKIFLSAFIIVVALTFVARLSFLQLYDENISKGLLDDLGIEAKYNYPERGYIYDRNGKLLVSNSPAYDIMVIPNKIKDLNVPELCKTFGITKEDFEAKMAKAEKFSPVLPSVFIQQLTKSDYAAIQEKMHKFSGFYTQQRMLRDYQTVNGANVLGYISEVNEWELQNNSYYQPGELAGRSGVEKVYEETLRGEKGVNYIQKDIYNRVIGSYKNGKYDTLPEQGHDISITIDATLEAYGELLMQHKRGGIVAIEPKTGEILALVSAPSFDPDLLVGRKRSKNYTELFNDSLAKPLYDRGLLAQYPPGSPFKIVNALVALQEGAITPETRVTCYHGYRYGARGFMACHCASGTVNDLNSGIFRSCNAYFANAYRRIIENYPTSAEGMEAWSKHVKSFGLGDFLHNDLSTGRPGYIPDSSFYNRWYGQKRWYYTTNISNAIGQGEVLTTPIQLANVAAIVANRGYYITPHIIKAIDGKPIDIPDYTQPKYTTVEKKYFEPIVQGMFDVYNMGTASRLKVSGINIGGKTGTAENFTKIDGKRYQLTDHSIFIAFAPVEDPKIAIAVFVENGSWGATYAGRIASLMIEKYLTGSISNTNMENFILNGNLQPEYDKVLTPEKLSTKK